MMTSKQLEDIKDEYLKCKDGHNYLCSVAYGLGLSDIFVEYLMGNLDDTMTTLDHEKYLARWKTKDRDSRIKWLDKHINKTNRYANK